MKIGKSFCLIVTIYASLYAADRAKSPFISSQKIPALQKEVAVTGTYSADSVIVKNILESMLDTIRSVSDVSDSANGRIVSLHINDLTYKNIPPEIGNLSALTSLDLSLNGIDSLPSAIWNLKLLTSLDLSGNNLTSLPDQIGNLNLLTSLNLSANSIANIPAQIGNLGALTILDISQNKLASLPGNIINLNKFSSPDTTVSCPNPCPMCGCVITGIYYYLNMHDNLLCNLPDSIKNWALKYDPPYLQLQNCAIAVRKETRNLSSSALLKITQTSNGLLISGTSLPDGDFALKIISANGRLIKSEKLHGSTGQISCVVQKSLLAKGLYIIQITGSNCRYLLNAIVK